MSDSPVATPSSEPIPDYVELTKFLFKPFLDHPEALCIDAEFSPARQKVLIRVAFGEEDKGRAFGRGGRNVSAIKTAIEGIAKASGHAAHIEIFGAGGNPASGSSEGRSSHPRGGGGKPSPRRRSS